MPISWLDIADKAVHVPSDYRFLFNRFQVASKERLQLIFIDPSISLHIAELEKHLNFNNVHHDFTLDILLDTELLEPLNDQHELVAPNIALTIGVKKPEQFEEKFLLVRDSNVH